jgi:hypothetical protein
MKKLFLLLLLLCGACSYLLAQEPATPDSTLQQYVGKYVFPEGSVVPDVVVTLDNGALHMTSTAGESPLEKQGDDLYAITQFQGTAKFNRNTDKKIVGVSIDAQGYKLEGTKVLAETTLVSPLRKVQQISLNKILVR